MTSQTESSSMSVSAYGRAIRRALQMALFLLLAMALLQFRTYRVPPGHDQFLFEYPPGKVVLYDRFFLYHRGWWPCLPSEGRQNLKEYNFVVFQKGRSLLLGQILALPGEAVVLQPKGFYVVRKEGKVFFPYPLPESPQATRQGLYLLLVATGEVVWVNLEQIRGKVVAAW